jgi:CrcB protein
VDLRILLYIGAGGALGSITRYGVSYLVQSRSTSVFPIATLLINTSGSLLLGFIMLYALESSAITAELRLLLTVGFCGGYTTFSSFGYETVRLLEEGDYARAALYVCLSIMLALAATFLGFTLARAVLAMRRGLGP